MFEPVRLEWEGREVFLPPDRRLMAVAMVEDTVTAGELGKWLKQRTVPYAKISLAYGKLLRFCGIDVTDEQIYAGMFAGDGKKRDRAVDAMLSLLTLMAPPEVPETDAKPNPTEGDVSRA